MLYWLAPIVAGVGWGAWRSWRRDASIRSGELMDVRDLLPDGTASLELRALQDRLYRVEIQLELEPAMGDGGEVSSDAADAIELTIHRSGLGGCDGADVLLHATQGSIRASVRSALRAGLVCEHADSGRMQGSLPIAEFDVDALVRLRFDLALAQHGLVLDTRSGRRRMRVVKAHAAIKERVRPLRLPGGVPERVRIATRQVL